MKAAGVVGRLSMIGIVLPMYAIRAGITRVLIGVGADGRGTAGTG